jgi:lipopolysaccharide/colanic/teichoic acid biosynthesis glycosyltransferase
MVEVRAAPESSAPPTYVERRPRGSPEAGSRHVPDSPPGPRDQATLEAEIEQRVQARIAGCTRRRPMYHPTKRALDLVVAVPVLVVALPLMALIALVIRLESGGPAVFRQRRVGQGGRTITFYKFRTMRSDARTRFPELYATSFTEADFQRGYYKPAADPRNTRFGAFIRKLTLDELPNLFNVVKGEVSLVGPRPELPEYLRFYRDDQLQKFTVPSGITGLAQVSGRNNLTIQEQIDADLTYVERCSLLEDVRLLTRTLVSVLGRVGAE